MYFKSSTLFGSVSNGNACKTVYFVSWICESKTAGPFSKLLDMNWRVSACTMAAYSSVHSSVLVLHWDDDGQIENRPGHTWWILLLLYLCQRGWQNRRRSVWRYSCFTPFEISEYICLPPPQKVRVIIPQVDINLVIENVCTSLFHEVKSRNTERPRHTSEIRSYSTT